MEIDSGHRNTLQEQVLHLVLENAQSEEAILRAIEKLIQHIDCTTIPPAGRDEFYDVVNQKWFAERVFDKYLWEKGGK